MSFLEAIDRARAHLQKHDRVSLRALRLELDLDEGRMEALVEELVDVQGVATREGNVLVAASAPAAAAPTSTPEPAETRGPRDYTPKHLGDKILRARSALEGERKQVTVLFADLARSMELAGELDPEAWHRILERFFEILADGVHRFEGTVNQYTGDGIMALFGAPIAHEDHAQRAAFASLHLVEALRPFAREVKREHGVTLSTRMGLNSGDVVVGKIGDDLRMDYTAQGHTVGLAQRMEALASPDTIYVTDASASLLEGYFELDDLGPFEVKGASEPVQVFQLLRPGASRTRFDMSRARGLTRFVGRDGEFRTLEDALAQARAGNGQVVGLVAEAGTGKSRLCFEFVERCRRDGIQVNEGQALPHGRNVPLLPVMQAFRDYYGIDERDDPRAVREKIAGRMVLLDAAFQDDLPLLFDFFGAPDPERPPPALDADARQRRLFQILRRTTQSVGGEAGVGVTLLEDLHWFDAASEEFVQEWVEAVAGNHSLLLLNFRPEYEPAWAGRSYYHQIPLAPLGEDAIRELLEDLLGSDKSTEGLAARIYERTGGNPFFAEEVAQSLIESGALVGDRGSYRLEGDVNELQVPSSVQSILAARIDRLSEREKQVLQAAAVIGKDFVEPVLREAVELPERDLAAALSALAQAEFVRQVEMYPVAEYTFKHPLTQEVALGSQLSERRQRVHAAVAAALEHFHVDRLDEKAGLLAHHYEEAGEASTSAAWHARAADWTSRTDWKQGNWHWRRVLGLTEDAPASPERDQQRLGATAAVLSTGWRLGLQVDEVEPLFEEARSIARGNRDRALESRIVGNWAVFVGNQGDIPRACELGRDACALLDDGVPDEVHAGTRTATEYATYCAGLHAESLEHADEVIRHSEGDHERGMDALGFPSWSNGLRFRALTLIRMGRFDEAAASLAKAEEVVAGQARSEVDVWLVGDWLHMAVHTGRTPEHDPRPAALEALDYCERVGSDFARASGLYHCMHAHAQVGDWEQARAAGLEALRVSSESEVFLQEKGFVHGWLAWVLRSGGRHAEAVECAAEGIAWCQAHGLAFQEALCRIESAAALRSSGGQGVAEVEGQLEPVDALLEATDGRSLLPQLIEERARLAALRGEDPRPGLEEALAVYREIGATGHAERLATELAG
jgi:class 3 adenylate cyclase/tetratricopeptide (TPR) repeat protein